MDNNDNELTWLLRLVRQVRSLGALFPIMTTVFIAFLVIGIAMPVLPLHVHQGLELSTFVVGLIAGSQFAAAILSRVWAGRYSDASGAKHAVIAGVMIAAAGGLLYLLSLRFVTEPATSATILLLGRALLGVGESFIITGAQSWGLAILGVQNTSKVLAWVGSAMFGAFAAGAPIGTALYARYGFTGIALATALLPLATLALVAPLRRIPSTARVRTGLLKVMDAVWVPGVGSALSSVGFGYSLVYPGLGVEAVRRVPAQSRGLAMGAYTAFLDVALGFGTPALGLLASTAGLGAVFVASAVAALCAAPIAASFLYTSARPVAAASHQGCR